MTYENPVEHKILLDHKLPALMYFFHTEDGGPTSVRLDGENINGLSRRDAKILQAVLEQAVENLERFNAPRVTSGSRPGLASGGAIGGSGIYVGPSTTTPMVSGGTYTSTPTLTIT